MSILLYNHTTIPDTALRRCLAWAAREMGVEGDVAVKVTSKRNGWGQRGTAYDSWPYLGHLRGDSYKKRAAARKRNGGSEKTVGLRSGYITLVLQADQTRSEQALETLSLMLHEMAHVAQYRDGSGTSLMVRERVNGSSSRRPAHDKRPIEVDAYNREYDVRQRAGFKARETHWMAVLMTACRKP